MLYLLRRVFGIQVLQGDGESGIHLLDLIGEGYGHLILLRVEVDVLDVVEVLVQALLSEVGHVGGRGDQHLVLHAP